METKKFAFWGGAVMVALGVLSLIPGLTGSVNALPALNWEASYGLFLGLFPMNILNKLALIVLGLAGLAVARDVRASIYYSRVVFFAMALLTILGLFPATNTLYGYWPLFGGEIALHAVFAMLGAYFGYAYSPRPTPRTQAV